MIDLVLEEKLDELDPLRHLRNDDDLQSNGIVPVQPPSVHGQIIHLSFPTFSIADDVPDPVAIKLAVDASPGCGGIAWPAGSLKIHRSSWISEREVSPRAGQRHRTRRARSGRARCLSLYHRSGSIARHHVPQCIHERPRLIRVRRGAELGRGEQLQQNIPRPDLILAADCVYFEPAFPLLVKTLADLVLDDSTEVLFCYKKRRKADKRFFTLLKKEFTWAEVTDDPERDAYSREAISLLRLSRKR